MTETTTERAALEQADYALSVAIGEIDAGTLRSYLVREKDKTAAALAATEPKAGEEREAELRRLSDAATNGPWKVFHLLPGCYEVCKADNYATGGVCGPHRREDADFIVAAVNHVRAALATPPQQPTAEPGHVAKAMEQQADAVLYPNGKPALRQQPAEPVEAGEFVRVPREPTEAMMRAGFSANKFVNPKPCGPTCVGRVTIPPRAAWSAMLAAAPSVPQDERELWKHVKRGTVYEVIGRGELQMGSDLVDGSAMVIYRGDDGRFWVREEGEFEDGRFVRVAPSAGSGEGVSHG